MPSLFAPLEWQGWENDQGTIQKLKAKRKEERSHWLSASMGFCWLVVCGFLRPGEVTSSRSLPGQVTAYSVVISISKGLGGEGSCPLYFCSEATFQNDVVAITALGCKRETLGIFQKKGVVAG